jgi:hypothetical protein
MNIRGWQTEAVLTIQPDVYQKRKVNASLSPLSQGHGGDGSLQDNPMSLSLDQDIPKFASSIVSVFSQELGVPIFTRVC